MDPPTSFKLPLLIKIRDKNQTVSPKILDRLNSSLAFKDTDEKMVLTKRRHEISPMLGMRLNPGYRMEYTMAKSEMKSQYPDLSKLRKFNITPPPDKLFYKKKDELVNYAESLFKNKILYSRK